MATVYSVGQVNTYIKNMFQQDFLLRSLEVRGEVSNCTYHSSGHIYFTLKDRTGTLSCVMFAGRRRGLTFDMREGDGVVVRGTVDVYERDGRYQLYADRIVKDGVGALNERYEQLKKQLEEEGLFDEAHKKPLPRYIKTLGVITAPTGAAVRDIIQVASRRNPYVQILLYPAIVQGAEAAPSLVRGLQTLQHTEADVIILGRGGGSLEDLWAFNEEVVARAVFASDIPVISAVGHETDTVITDYVADRRAPTPSAAAELAVYEADRLDDALEAYKTALRRGMTGKQEERQKQAKYLRDRLEVLSPANRIREKRMHALRGEERLRAVMREMLQEERSRLPRGEVLRDFLKAKLEERRGQLRDAERLPAMMQRSLQERRHRMELAAGRLETASPVRRLSGGFGYVTETTGRVVTAASKLTVGERLNLRFRDGRATVRTEEVAIDEASNREA